MDFPGYFGLDYILKINFKLSFKKFLEEKGLGMGAVLPNFRVLVTGLGMGPSMFAIAELLGKKETLERMTEGIEKVRELVA